MSQFRVFAEYVVPSVLAYALAGVYAIVDGFFVGHSMGDAGLSAINIAFPVVTLMQSIGTGIGMGGAVLWTVRKSAGDLETAEKYVRVTWVLLIAASAAVTAGLLPFTEQIMRLFGAEGEILRLGKEYLNVIVLGAGCQILAMGIVPMIRNNGSSFFALVVMVSGFFPMAGKIGTIGIAPFGLTLSPMISLTFINRFSMAEGGAAAVACYACIAYALTIVQVLMQGVGDGSQPLMSRYYGEGRYLQVREVRKMAYVSIVVLAVVCNGILFLTRWRLGDLFGASESIRIMVGEVLPVFLIGLVFYGFSHITTSGFYATEKNLYSYICVYGEPAFLLALLFLLPAFWGQSGVWWSVVLSQVLTAVLALFLKAREDRNSPEEQR